MKAQTPVPPPQRLLAGPENDPDLRDCLLHQLFEAQVERTPRRLALTVGETHLTYLELNQRANQLGHHMRALGVGPEVLVGVVAERSVDTIVALLAVLKAGGAYVPLDPDHPSDRLSFMLDDAGISVVVASRAMRGRFRSDGRSIVRSDSGGPLLAHYSTGNLPPITCPNNLAYVIYTSGSTGQPKGVLIPHQQIVNSTRARSAFGRWSPGDYEGGAYVVAVPISFDASAAGIYWSLTTGGRLVLAEEDAAHDPKALARLIEEQRATHFTHMPSFYRLVLQAGGTSLKSLRDISVGGEQCTPQLVGEHYRALPWTRLFNDYGPTEGTIWATTHLCTLDEAAKASIPIGTPIQNVVVYLLDENLNPVPSGATGEIYLGGHGVARGYLRRPDHTAERFFPDRFSDTAGSRIYKTGDLGRRRADGALDFLGRADSQVKVRGFRVELEEIEVALQEHPKIAAAVVSQLDGPAEPARLVACVVARGEESVDRRELVEFLRRRLPDYMIPTMVVWIDEVPLNAHAKVDRSAVNALVRTANQRVGFPGA